jgi:hypothetical protein
MLAQLKADPADPDRAARLRTVARDHRQLALLGLGLHRLPTGEIALLRGLASVLAGANVRVSRDGSSRGCRQQLRELA